MKKIIDWLLKGAAWIEYNTRIHLMNQSENEAAVVKARNNMIKDDMIRDLIEDVSGWPWIPMKNHKKADHPIHKISFLAEIGVKIDDININGLTGKILDTQSEEGMFQLISNIPTHFGGTGKDELTWMLCDAPLMLYILIQLGVKAKEKLKKSADYIVELVRENGWPCVATSSLGKFRGPGKKGDPCPYYDPRGGLQQ